MNDTWRIPTESLRDRELITGYLQNEIEIMDIKNSTTEVM